jgi:hypothetical protein
MRLREFLNIFEGYKEAQADFSKQADSEIVKTTISQFKELVNKNQVTGDERNIDYWRKQGWPAFLAAVRKYSTKPTKREVKNSNIVGRSANLDESDDWLVVIPLDKDASCFHGKDTDWCTTKSYANYFEDYFYDKEVTLIYCLSKADGGKWAVAGHTKSDQIECFNQVDDPITPEAFEQNTGYNPYDLVERAHNEYGDKLNDARVHYLIAMDKIEMYFNGNKSFSDDIEDLLAFTKTPRYCARYIEEQGFRDYPKEIVYAAIRSDSRILANVKTITPAMKKSMVRANPSIIGALQRENRLTEQEVIDLGKIAISQKNTNIQYINNPPEELQLYAVSLGYHVISDIDAPSLAVQRAAVKASGNDLDVLYMIRYEYRRPEIFWHFYKKDLINTAKQIIEFLKTNDMFALKKLTRTEEYGEFLRFVNVVDKFKDSELVVKQFAERAHQLARTAYRTLSNQDFPSMEPWRQSQEEDRALATWESEGITSLQKDSIEYMKSGSMDETEARIFLRLLTRASDKFKDAVQKYGKPEQQVNYQRKLRSVASTINTLTNYRQRLVAQQEVQ